jgi:hypothetical protein
MPNCDRAPDLIEPHGNRAQPDFEIVRHGQRLETGPCRSSMLGRKALDPFRQRLTSRLRQEKRGCETENVDA